MTPQEKAKQLYDKFNRHCSVKNFFGDNVESYNTKSCALIAVDEILNNEEYLYLGEKKNVKYWQEVKTKIEEL
jgi:hypothetical protein